MTPLWDPEAPRIERQPRPPRIAVPAIPPGTLVRAKVPLAHPAPGVVLPVLDTTANGDVRLRISPDFIAHAAPEHLEIVTTGPHELDTDPL